MRRLSLRLLVAALVFGIAFAPAGCKRRKRREAKQEQTVAGPASMLHTADPAVASQLIRGFHQDDQPWRWTEKEFAVKLRPPATSAQTGATLNVQLTIAEAIAKLVGPQTLSARVAGVNLPPETYPKPGTYAFTREVPSSVLRGDLVTVEFSLDRAADGVGADTRQLGVIVSSVGFEAKQ